ncbi:response regulator transcription factor [Zavarzinia sp.]|uniref:helix-turn-helix transcriptional regulator n=1 Tax=Zavarzinia sp. TaxID=2027920 RepID=UPI003563479F
MPSPRPAAWRKADGASGATVLYLTIETDAANAEECIRAALPEGSRLQIQPATGGTARRSAPPPPGPAAAAEGTLPELTARQREILDLLARDLSNKEIGRLLSLSHFTVRNHISQLLRLLGVPTRRAAIEKLNRLRPRG